VKHTVLIYDRRGTGASDVDYSDMGADGLTENEAQRDDLAELITFLRLGRVILMGYSSGTLLASPHHGVDVHP
jgi:pimeloyl-ACP methyl ester carboxylesterase